MAESGAGAVDEARSGSSTDGGPDGALQGLRDVLGADGYRLDYAVQNGHELVVSVVAGPGACADCLVPKQVMEGILADALQGTDFTVARVEMPAVHA